MFEKPGPGLDFNIVKFHITNNVKMGHFISLDAVSEVVKFVIIDSNLEEKKQANKS